MAKYESKVINGDFDTMLKMLDDGILGGSISAHLEDSSYYVNDDIRCAVKVYERYSAIGGNRISMSITLIGCLQELFVSVITSGGSQAVFFKINTLGEESFLKHAIGIVEHYKNWLQQANSH
ncbi:MAG: DUF6054 family protein [Defluviitaleaceae bacterium]|nr:DUF6054 family protein [Defluviitaleaceae bacterium]